MRLGRRDRLWLTVMILVVAILLAIKMASRDGFSDPGKPVWKSAVLGSDPKRDTTDGEFRHSSSVNASHGRN